VTWHPNQGKGKGKGKDLWVRWFLSVSFVFSVSLHQSTCHFGCRRDVFVAWRIWRTAIIPQDSTGDCDNMLKSWSKNKICKFTNIFEIYYLANYLMVDICKAIIDKQNEIWEKLASVGGSGLDSSG